MAYYFAPLEGITDRIYRNLHRKYFSGVDRYFTPFFSPTMHRVLTAKELRELEFTPDLQVIPQILTKESDDFIWMAQQCQSLGYTQINLNLGCPSGTVTAKGKGAGMLRDISSLDGFLDRIFSASPLPVSIKTRIGFEDSAELPALLQVWNQYPVCELIIHPRVRNAFYKGTVDMAAFEYALQHSRNPVCYNGDLFSYQQVEQLRERYPNVNIMLGRGLIADPGMLCGGTDTATLQRFYTQLEQQYLEAFGSARNTMFRLKEHWGMLQGNFAGGEKLFKALRKTTDLSEYHQLTAEIFASVPFTNPHK